MTFALTIVAAPAIRSVDPHTTSPPSRCTIGLRHYRRSFPFAPSPQAMAGALSIYREGERHDDVRRMLFGLSILRGATEEQLRTLLGKHGAARPTRASFEDEPAPLAALSL